MSAPLEPGDRLGGYRIEAHLGEGAMGTVYAAWDTEEERRVAVKVLHPALLQSRSFLRRIQREAMAGERVQHPNVVRILECDLVLRDGEPHFALVMEHVDGTTVRDMLADAGLIPAAGVRELGAQVAAGLAAIHAAGLVHRDLKPENLMVRGDGTVCIMDLGMARFVDVLTTMTAHGAFGGTREYAAPEQLAGAETTPATDLFSLGVILFELLAGERPTGALPPSAVPCPDRSLADLVQSLLDPDPSARPPDAAAVEAVLRS